MLPRSNRDQEEGKEMIDLEKVEECPELTRRVMGSTVVQCGIAVVEGMRQYVIAFSKPSTPDCRADHVITIPVGQITLHGPSDFNECGDEVKLGTFLGDGEGKSN